MTGSREIRARSFRRAAIAIIALTAAAVVTERAQAQNLLESLFNAIGGRSANAPAPVSANRADPGAWDILDRGGERSTSPGGGAATYCVRLCDGRYFPLPRKTGSVTMSNAQICSAMCPAAKTAVFNGSAIERAVGDNGKSYSSLQTAFLYRDKTVSDCSCKPGGQPGVASLDAKDDPTLRRGDIVVTRDGPLVFTGDERKNRAQAFVRPDEFKGLSQSVRLELATMRIARDASESASLPAGAAPVSYNGASVAGRPELLPTTSISYTPTVAPVQVTPVAEAFSSFSR
jgi:hypothetical protein